MISLLQPRIDGVCCECGKKDAVTADGRFCRTCLRGIVSALTPMIGCFPRLRFQGEREDVRQTKYGDTNPLWDNLVRAYEEDR